MKTKRFLSTLLALLLVCSLPVSAFADLLPNNPADKTVDIINKDDVMSGNNGTVTTNEGTLHYNDGLVTSNNADVVSNSSKGTVTNNNKGATVNTNYGTVDTNYGTVGNNTGTVTTNNGTVSCAENSSKIITNNGTVAAYNLGTVETNNGIVNGNYGTVETNNITGVVTNKSNKYEHGTVGTNYGTVNEADGTTHYGIQVDNDGDVSLEQKQAGEVLDFSQLTKEGYVYAGYTQAYGMENGKVTLLDSPLTVTETSYTVTCPNVLTLIWQAIAAPAAASDDGAGSFGPGSVISLGGHKFLLVAVVEDVYCLASVDSFGDEELSDLPALLASLLTEEQLSHVTGEPELLDEALTARFFAGQGSHIVFPCDSGLIFS